MKNDLLPSYVTLHQFYRQQDLLLSKVTRKMSLAFNVHYPWFDNWFNEIDNYDIIIVFAVNKINSIINVINKKIKYHQRLIMFFWDPVFRVKDCLNVNCEKWTFDKVDAKNYNLKLNSTFYFKNILLPQSANIYDVYFVGRLKGRGEILSKLRILFQSLALNVFFYTVDETKKSIPLLNFDENLYYISKTKAILDIVQNGQSGLTLRVMESIFFKKKLITTQASLKLESFYHPNNILILEEDKLCYISKDIIHKFLDLPFINVESSVLDFYDFNMWLSRFGENNKIIQ